MLPTTSTSVHPITNGLSKISKVNYYVLGSLVWFLLSVMAIIGGIYHCRSNSFSYDVYCEPSNGCLLSSTVKGVPKLKIARNDITIARVVRLNKKNDIVETNGMRRRELSRLGSTLELTYRKRPDQSLDADASHHTTTDGPEISTILFPPIDMGGNGRPAKTAKRKIDDFISNRSEKVVRVNNGKVVTVMGILCILGGIFSTILSCFIGVWADPKNPKKKFRFTGQKRKD